MINTIVHSRLTFFLPTSGTTFLSLCCSSWTKRKHDSSACFLAGAWCCKIQWYVRQNEQSVWKNEMAALLDVSGFMISTSNVLISLGKISTEHAAKLFFPYKLFPMDRTCFWRHAFHYGMSPPCFLLMKAGKKCWNVAFVVDWRHPPASKASTARSSAGVERF